jgi:hypothetical protein
VSADLHALPPSALDIPAVLRYVADSVEAGEYGEVVGCAIALDADNIRVMWGGLGERGPCAHLLLTLGAHRITLETLEAKR